MGADDLGHRMQHPFIRAVAIAAVGLGGCEPPVDAGGVELGRRVLSDERWVATAQGARFTVALRTEIGGLGVETVEIVQPGAGEIASAVDQDFRAAESGTLELRRRGVVEMLAATPDGIEQGWRFQRRPEGDGALTVRVAATGLPYSHLDDTVGLIFGTGEEAMRYGHGTWIDSSGHRTEVPASWRGGTIELTVPSDVVASSVYPAVLDPIIGPAHPVAEPDWGSVGSVGKRALVATNGTDYLVVMTWASGGQSRAVRVAADGTIVDRPPVVLPPARCLDPALTRGASTYALLCRTTTSLELYFIGDDLSVSAPVVITDPTGFQRAPAIAYGAGIYLLVWANADTATDIHGARVRADGTVLDTTPLVIANGPNYQLFPTTAWLGSRFYVAYHDDRYTAIRSDDLRGTVVRTDGVVASPGGDVLFDDPSYDESWPTLFSSPSGALLTYVYRDTTLLGALLNPDGSLGMTLSGSLMSSPLATAAGSWTGSDWIVVQSNGSPPGLDAVRVSPLGTVSPYGVPDYTSMAEHTPSVAWGGSAGLLTYHDADWSSGADAVYAVRLESSGWVGPRLVPHGRATNVEEGGAAAAVSGGYVAIYTDSPSGGSTTQSVAVDLGGAQRAPAQELIDYFPGGCGPSTVGVDIATGDSSSLVVGISSCSTSTRFYRWVVNANGERTSLILGISWPSAGSPALAWNGASYLLTVGDAGSISFQTLTTTGAFLGARTRLSGGSKSGPDVAASGSTFLVVWRDASITAEGQNVHALRVAADGTAIERDPIVIAGGAGDQRSPAVSRNATGWIVAWADDRPAPLGGVYHRLVADDGTMSAPVRLAPLAAPTEMIRVAWGGEHSAIAWGPYRSDERLIAGAIVDPSGATAEAPSLWVSDAPATATSFMMMGDLASVGGDQFLLTYGAYDPRVETERVYARAVNATVTVGTTCTSDSECGTNPCVDGVCCADDCAGGSADCRACSIAAGAAVDGLCGPIAGARTCRAAVGPCDVAETCDGTSPTCPMDAFLSGTVCRPAAGACDVAEVCSGSLPGCAPDTGRPDGTPCDDALVCNGSEACVARSCVTVASVDCDDGSSCTMDACDEASGCTHTMIAGCADGGTAIDGGSSDGGAPSDGGALADSGAPADGGALADASVALDGGGGAVDAGSTDGAVPIPDGDLTDGALADAGGDSRVPEGGCCSVAPGAGRHRLGLTAAILVLILGVGRYRRRRGWRF